MGLFPYIGSDTRIAPRIVELLPRTTTMIEAFGGAGSVSLYCAEKNLYPRLIWNDLDKAIYHAFKLIRDSPSSISLISSTLRRLEKCVNKGARKRAKMLLNEVRENLLNDEYPWPWDGFWTIVLHYVCHVPYKSGLMLRWVDRVKRFQHIEKKLTKYHRLLQKITLLNADALDLISNIDEEDVAIYVDPPHLTSSAIKTGYYRLPFTCDDAMQLDEALRGADVKILVKLSEADRPYYKITRKWRQATLRYYVDSKPNRKSSKGIYYLYMNYEPATVLL